jgi:hypothetical protein
MTFGRPTLKQLRAQRVKQRRRNLKALATPSRALQRGTYAGATVAPAPKAEKAKPGKKAPTVAERALSPLWGVSLP